MVLSPQSERKNKKSGAAASHAKVAERLLAAHMRREALNHAQSSRYVDAWLSRTDK